ncbi:actin-domain-containing protein [Xylariaceae sp. FL0662B]|nr:actin-domain-containing protein [Xylariaceae sp. FL0662B]
MKWSTVATGVASLAVSVVAQTDSTPFTDADTGIIFQSYTTEEGITLALALPEDAGSDSPYDAIIQITSPVENGWAGWAWGGQMTYNPLTVVWANGDSVVHSSRQALGYYLPALYEDATYTVLEKGTSVNETHFKFTALCSGCTSWSDFDGNPYYVNGAGDASFAYAYSTTPVEDPADPEGGFSIHDSVGRWIHDTAGARSADFASWVDSNKAAEGCLYGKYFLLPSLDPRATTSIGLVIYHIVRCTSMAPARKSKVYQPSPPSRTLVLDNGAYTMKAGFVSGDTVDKPRVIPNCIARDRDRKTYVSSELEKCNDFSEVAFRRPVEKGFVVNWEAEKEIWEHEFLDNQAPQQCDPAETRLLLAEPSNSLPILQTNCDQVVFEEFGFTSYYRGIGPTLNAYHDIQAIFRTPRDPGIVAQLPAEIILLIDTGYSHTTVTPILQGRPIHPAVRRLDVGGKLLTNYLTRLLSLRHYDMRNETHIVNEMKEAACYVSLDFNQDLERTWKGTRGERRNTYLNGGGIAKDYILPDFHTRTKGIVRDYDASQASRTRKLAVGQLGEASEDVLTLRNERFTVPELLFHPSDIGIPQSGIPHLVMQSLEVLPIGLWPGLLANILVVGGNSLFDGFVQRLQEEVVKLVPDECVVRVARPADAITSTWLGGANLARHEHINALSVTKQEYEEFGAAWVARKFANVLES